LKGVVLLAWFWIGFGLLAAQAPGSNARRDTQPPLLTTAQFVAAAHTWPATKTLRVQGVVTASMTNKYFFLQDGDTGLQVVPQTQIPYRVGQWLEVNGIPSLGGVAPSLQRATVSLLGTRESPVPKVVTFEEAISGTDNNRLVRIRGRLTAERPRGRHMWILTSEQATNGFLADLESVQDLGLLEQIKSGSLLDLTGVCSVRARSDKRLSYFIIFVRSRADVVVIGAPPWWTPTRMLGALGGAFAALGLALLWGGTLRRQVRLRTADLRARLEKETVLEQRYRQLFEANPHSMWVYDRKTLGFLAVNEAAIRQYGYSRAEFLLLTLPDLRPRPEDRVGESSGDPQGPKLKTAGFQWHRKKDGQNIEVEVTSHTMDFDGHPAEVVLALDITERCRAEAELRRSEHYRRAIIEAEPECVKVVSAKGALLDMNAAGLVMLEADSLTEAQACPLMQYVFPEYHEAFADLHRRVMAGGSGVLAFEIHGLKGTRRWVKTHAVLMPGTDGSPPALLGITRDITDEKRAQAALQRSEERFATVFRASPDGILIVRASDERIVEVNPAYVRLSGFVEEELKGRTTAEVNLWTDPERRSAAIARLKENGSISNLEFLIRTKNGRTITVLGSGEMIQFGGEACLLSITRDITDRKNAEDALRRSEASLAAAQHIAALGSWEMDLGPVGYSGHNPLSWSDEVFRIFGYEPGGLEVTSENFFRAVHPEDRERVRQAVVEAIEQRQPYRIEHRILRSDGVERIVQEYCKITFDSADGRPLRMLGVVQDITERKQTAHSLIQTQQALQKSEHYFRALIERSSDGIAVFAADGTMRYQSPTAAVITGYEIDDLLGSHALSYIHPEDFTAAENRFRRLVRTPGASERFEIRICRKDGKTVWIEEVAQNLLRDPAVQGIVVNFRDVTERLSAELALRESEKRFRRLIDYAPEAVVLLDVTSGRFLLANAAAEELFKMSAPELRQLGTIELSPPQQPDGGSSREKAGELVARACAGETAAFEWTFRNALGRDVPCEVRLLSMELEGRAVIRGSLTDISARKEAELERQRAFETLQLFIDSVPGYISFIDADQRYQLVNPRYEQWFGRTRNEIVGCRLEELQSPAAYEEMKPLVASALAGEVIHYERCVASPDGEAHWFDIRYIPRRDVDGTVTGIFALVFDITIQKNAELALCENRERLDGILSSLDDVVWSSSPDGSRMLYLNPAAQRIYGRPLAEFFDRPHLWQEVVHPEDVLKVGVAFEELGRRGTFNAEYRIVRPDGMVRWVRDRGRLVKDSAGQPLRLDGIGTDITRQREAEEKIRNVNHELELRVAQRTRELALANQELEAFSYSVSHDLRAPLRAIEGFSKFLQMECAPQLEAKGLGYLDRVRAGTQRMGALIDGLLKLSRLKRMPMTEESVDLSLLAEGCLFELQASEPGRVVETVVAPNLSAKGDLTLLRAALQNLLGNAWKYSCRVPNARIEVGVLTRESECVFYVRDNGAGFDMTYAERLFEAFQRLHSSSEFEGTGIGLATVQRIIQRHGGRIWAQAAVNQGATFYFTLAPLIEPTLSDHD